MYGCTSKEIHKDSGLMKITDDNGRQVAFSKKPERIVVLSPSFLELLEVLDGNVVDGRNTICFKKLDVFFMHPLISDNQIRLQFYYFFSIDIKNKANNSSIFGKISNYVWLHFKRNS